MSLVKEKETQYLSSLRRKGKEMTFEAKVKGKTPIFLIWLSDCSIFSCYMNDTELGCKAGKTVKPMSAEEIESDDCDLLSSTPCEPYLLPGGSTAA